MIKSVCWSSGKVPVILFGTSEAGSISYPKTVEVFDIQKGMYFNP